MVKTDGSVGQSAPKEPVRNLHVEVPESFHRRIKMLCAMQGGTLKDYALEALKEKVARDEKAIKPSKRDSE